MTPQPESSACLPLEPRCRAGRPHEGMRMSAFAGDYWFGARS